MAEFTLPDNCRLIAQPSPGIMDEIYRLRVSAWRARTNAFPDMDVWRDAYDDNALHWAIVAQEPGQSDNVIASARMTIHSALSEVPNSEIYDGLLPADLPGPIASINRLVVAKAYAGQGLPHILDMTRIHYAREAGCQHIVLETYAGMRRHDELIAKGFVPLGKAKPYRDGPLAKVKEKRGGGEICYCLRL